MLVEGNHSQASPLRGVPHPGPFLAAALLAGLLSWFPVPIVPGAFAAPPLPADKPPGWEGWYAASPDEGTKIHLYFFWSGKCPHCLRAKPFVESLRSAYPWLAVHSLELGESRENAELYLKIASAIGEQAKSVPAFLFCERLHAGYDDERNAGVFLKNQLLACRQNLRANVSSGPGKAAPDAGKTPVVLPFMGQIDPSAFSLPVLTLIVAGMDAFNPCAFFVLLFLLSLLVHTRSRAKMAFIGGTFVLFSGLVYFVFMAAWLNVFLLLGELKAVTAVAGAVAVTLALVNVKDYFFFGTGPSLSIPESAKPGLFRRMRSLTESSRLPALAMGTVVLAITANAYEILCTSGFPMAYTRILTLHRLSPAGYYFYLAFYNLVYVLPLAAIVAVFIVTLGSRKLREEEGRFLKLLSGLMMLGLGVLLLAAPEKLNDLVSAAVLLGGAIAISFLIAAVAKAAANRKPGQPGFL